MWNIKTKVITRVTGATEIISKSSKKHLSNIPGKRDIKELKKTITLGAAHMLWKVLTQKDEKCIMGNDIYKYRILQPMNGCNICPTNNFVNSKHTT
jgi:hypothetical protein